MRIPSIRLARVAGIPIRADLGVALLAVVVAVGLANQLLPLAFPGRAGWVHTTASIGGAIGLVGSILLHEIGHAVAARRNGIGVRGITLWVLGGQAELDRLCDTPRAEFQVAAAGPAANGALAALLSVSGWWIHSLTGARIGPGVLGWLAIMNLVIAISNLIPVAPLDGGRILTAWLWARRGDAETARILTARLGLVAGGSLALAAIAWLFADPTNLNAWILLVTGGFIVPGARMELAAAVIRRRLATTVVASVMSPLPPPVTVGTLATAIGAGPPSDAVVGVTRWTHEPVGWVTTSKARRLPAPAAAMTTAEALMTPERELARVRADESLRAVVDRLDLFGPEAFVGRDDPIVVEDWEGRRVGGLTPGAIAPLLSPPNWWGHTVVARSDAG